MSAGAAGRPTKASAASGNQAGGVSAPYSASASTIMATPAGAAEERLKYWAIVTLPILTLYVLQTCTPVCPPQRGQPPCR